MFSDSEITGRIIGLAYKVHNTLGAGFLESVYERALEIELLRAGLNPLRQVDIPVFYENEQIGCFTADFMVDDIIIELKAVKALAVTHEVQLVNYLVATGKSFGLLINFGEAGVEVKRKFRVAKSHHPVNPDLNLVHPV